MGGASWALAITTRGGERLASAELARWQFPHHIFWLRVEQVRRGRVHERLVPAFARYVFVPFADCWRIVENIWHVCSLVKCGDEPVCAPENEVENLVERCGGTNVLPYVVPAKFTQGDAVVINGYGPLRDLKGFYDHALGSGRACLLLDWMGRMVPVEVEEAEVELATVAAAAAAVAKKRNSGRWQKRRR